MADDIDVGQITEVLNDKADLDLNNTDFAALENNNGTLTWNGKNVVVIDIFNQIYPVGSIYIGTQSTCPMAIAIPGSTWERIESGRALWTGNGSNGNTKIAAGLPDHTHKIKGAWRYNGKVNNSLGDGSANDTVATLQDAIVSASQSNSIYGNSTTVQPPAYVVNVWRRTA